MPTADIKIQCAIFFVFFEDSRSSAIKLMNKRKKQCFVMDPNNPTVALALFPTAQRVHSRSSYWKKQHPHFKKALHHWEQVPNHRAFCQLKQLNRVRWETLKNSHRMEADGIFVKSLSNEDLIEGLSAKSISMDSSFKGTVSWDRFQKCWQKFTELDLTKGHGWFSNFLEGSNDFKMLKVYFLRLMPVCVGLKMVSCLFLSVPLIKSGV